MLLARRVRPLDGSPSAIPVVTNLSASRQLMAAALGIADPQAAAAWFARRSAAGIDPLVVERKLAPVQQIVLRGEQASLLRLPVLTQHELKDRSHIRRSGRGRSRAPECRRSGTRVTRVRWTP